MDTSKLNDELHIRDGLFISGIHLSYNFLVLQNETATKIRDPDIIVKFQNCQNVEF